MCVCVCNRPDSSSHGRAPETPEDEDDDESPERQRVRQRRPSLKHRYHIKTQSNYWSPQEPQFDMYINEHPLERFIVLYLSLYFSHFYSEDFS